MQLRNSVAELHRGKVPSDAMLLRFLRAREYNVEKGREMLCQSLVWRKKHQIDRLLADYQQPDVVSKYFCGGWHGSDRGTDAHHYFIKNLILCAPYFMRNTQITKW